MLRWLLLLAAVFAVACTASHQSSGAGSAGTPVVAGTPGPDSDSGIEFETDEPAPSVSVLPHHQVVVVVRIVNHDDERHSFLAKATLLDQQGATIRSWSSSAS